MTSLKHVLYRAYIRALRPLESVVMVSCGVVVVPGHYFGQKLPITFSSTATNTTITTTTSTTIIMQGVRPLDIASTSDQNQKI